MYTHIYTLRVHVPHLEISCIYLKGKLKLKGSKRRKSAGKMPQEETPAGKA